MEALRYNLIFYDAKIMQDFIFQLLESKGKNISQVKFAYILHDKDYIESTGEIKKAHYHLWLEFPQPVRDIHLINYLDIIGSNASAISKQKTDRNFLAYLTHDTKNSLGVKCMYNVNDIQTNIDKDIFNEWYYDAVANVTKPTKSEKAKIDRIDAFGRLYDIVKDNEEITDLASMINFLRENGEYDLIDFYIKKPYAVKMAFDSIYNDNRDKYFGSQIKTKNTKKLGGSRK